jgi:HSP20 family protein
LRRDPRTPEIDLIDRGDAFVVLADLPGFDTADLSVTVSDGTLTLEAVSEATGHRSGRYLKQEREGSTMRRTVSLPEPVDADTVTTAYRRGVVQVVVEKTVAETPDAVQRN